VTFKVFAEEDVDHYLSERESQLTSEIAQATDDYILNVGEAQFTEYLVAKYAAESLVIDFAGVFAETGQELIRAELFPATFLVEPGQQYLKTVVTYHLPFSGEARLLRCTPRRRLMWTTPVEVSAGLLTFKLISFDDSDAERLKQEAESTLRGLRGQWDNLRGEIDGFNGTLPERAASLFRTRRDQALGRVGLAAALGVPIRKREGIPATFSVPGPILRKKIVVTKPVVTQEPYAPDPTIDEEVYSEILNVIWELGTELEKLPSSYMDKQEENLRDYLLLLLQPQFAGNAGGETFNKSGKTDILLKHEGKNVFVAECKFWSGPSDYLKAITQLLAYLTWRDSKTALVLFVRNKGFSEVLAKIEEATPDHGEFVAFIGKRNDSFLSYRFRLPGDPGREVKVAVLAFHLSAAG
jgi:hypothetical protein